VAQLFSLGGNHALMRIILLFVILALCVFGCGSHATIDEHKIVGAWQVVSPYPIDVIFKFNEDHTYAMGRPGKNGKPTQFAPPCGHWRLDDNNITTDMGLMDTNDVEATAVLLKNSVPYRVTTLNDSSMVWHDDTHVTGMTWKRISP
jgi:hypothetical protein